MPSKSQSILLGAAFYVVASLIVTFLAINGGQAGQTISGALCCIVAIAAPMVAVWHYTNTYSLTIPAGSGAGMGAIVVAGGGVVSYLIQLALQAAGVFPSNAEIIERTRDQMLQQGMEAEQIDQIMGWTEAMQGPVGAGANLVVAAIIGAIGGIIAALVFKKGHLADSEL